MTEDQLKAALRNPACPPEILIAAVREQVWFGCDRLAARAIALANPSCPPEAIREMVLEAFQRTERRKAIGKTMDEADERKLCLAVSSPACPDDVATLIAGSQSTKARMALLRRTDLTPDTVRMALLAPCGPLEEGLSNPACPEDLLREYAGSPSRWTREAIARNPNCPRDLLRQLLDDTEERVRAAALANPNCPPEERAAAELAEIP